MPAQPEQGIELAGDGDNETPGRANASEIARLLNDPDTLKFLAVQRGISLEEAAARVREIVEALERTNRD